MSKIKAIILDLDGVVIGTKAGYNFPNAHPVVIKRLQEVKNSGIPISLCTAKYHYSINKLIKQAELDNLHITDNGAILLDIIKGKLQSKKIINKQIALHLLKEFSPHMYTEVFTVSNWYAKKAASKSFIEKRSNMLHRQPILSNNLIEMSKDLELFKINFITKNKIEKTKLDKKIQPYKNKVKITWTSNPNLLQKQFCVITSPGISKRTAAYEISQSLEVPLENILGVGDNVSDWQFIELCGYGGAMGNATQELKELVLSKGITQGYVGKHVDDHGLLDIFDKFLD